MRNPLIFIFPNSIFFSQFLKKLILTNEIKRLPRKEVIEFLYVFLQKHAEILTCDRRLNVKLSNLNNWWNSKWMWITANVSHKNTAWFQITLTEISQLVYIKIRNNPSKSFFIVIIIIFFIILANQFWPPTKEKVFFFFLNRLQTFIQRNQNVQL